MAEINLSSEDLTVLGGPSSITLETNFGAPGNRGVFVLYGLLNPNDPNASFITTPQIFDLYIVTDPSSDDYLQLYQYLNQDGIIAWYPAVKLSINFYGANRLLTFEDGEATIYINIFDLGLVNLRQELPTLAGTKHYFNVQATLSNYEATSLINPAVPENNYPAALTVKVSDIEQDPVTDELFVPITFKAAEFDGTNWQAINNKNVIANIAIFVVDPTDVTDLVGGA
jgi:hypothetical protein